MHPARLRPGSWKNVDLALVAGPFHAVPQHSHRAGSGGDVVCFNRRCSGAVHRKTVARSNRLILLGSAVWVALVLLNWGVSFFVV